MSYFFRWRLAKAKRKDEARYYNGTTPLHHVWYMRRTEFEKRFPGQKAFHGKGPYYLGNELVYVGIPEGKTSEHDAVPVQRLVRYNVDSPRLHACNAKCQNATGPNCECICGGANHGAMNNAGMS